MRNLGAVEAANEIRHDVFDMPGIDPGEQHQIRFVQGVCSQLGLDHTPENMHKVAVVLHKHDIGLHVGQEYPKVARRGYDKATKVVNDEQGEKEWVEEAPPEPASASDVAYLEPVQGTEHVDLTKQVPGSPKTMEHPAGRAPDEQTNQAASLLGMAHDDGKAAHDHNPGSVDDGDHVEFEDPASAEPAAAPVTKPPRKRPE